MIPPTPLVSLRDMLYAYCGFLGNALIQLRTWESLFDRDNERDPSIAIEQGAVDQIGLFLDMLVTHARLARLDSTVTLALHTKRDLYPWTKAGVAAGRMGELLRRMHHELAGHEFFYVPADRATYYNQPYDGWGDVPTRFPKAKPDIAEAGCCFALARPTATVFHLMRVAEIGLRVLAWDRRVTLTKHGRVLNTPLDLVQWDQLLRGLEKAEQDMERLRKTPAREAQLAFYHGAMVEVRAFKNLYRNRVMHTRESYKMHHAASAMGHVRSFMLTLAERLSEDERMPLAWTGAQLRGI